MPHPSSVRHGGPSDDGSQLATIAGRDIEYRLFGKPGARPPRVVLLHEGLGCVEGWRGFAPALAQRLGEPVLAYSRYGYGRSQVLTHDRDVGFMHDEARHALPALLAHFGIAAPLLVGHSDGASIALIHAGLPGSRVAAVVAMAPHLFVEPVTLDAIRQARIAFDQTDLPARMARYHRDPARTFDGWCNTWLDPRFADWNIEAQVAQIRCPVLAIQGVADQYGTMRQIESIAELCAETELLRLDDCRHSPHLDQPERVLSAIARFVQRFPTPAA